MLQLYFSSDTSKFEPTLMKSEKIEKVCLKQATWRRIFLFPFFLQNDVLLTSFLKKAEEIKRLFHEKFRHLSICCWIEGPNLWNYFSNFRKSYVNCLVKGKRYYCIRERSHHLKEIATGQSCFTQQIQLSKRIGLV